ncbi:hypothetical protein D3874_25410 [Oleomonas cavernae]|uniref:Uncharacterized protein n=1 Tax=Oleomonas cavernae TaxID=2320859 RepID=A0A418VTJ2_9PROT|nr:hypothetical protein [Oleomonas cavernae]RJF80475.1 hypothetical protein D3874_25410 [Oleomonas cavernae]
MLDLESPIWETLEGGYRVVYDPRPALLALERGENVAAAWDELWNELHHQGDVGEASYAAVPHLVRIYAAGGAARYDTYAIVEVVEECRLAGNNPPLPDYLREPYEAAWRQLAELALRDLPLTDKLEIVSCILAVMAMSKGLSGLARIAAKFDESEREEMIRLYFQA